MAGTNILMDKKESFLKTAKGNLIHPFALQIEEIDINEVASSLSKIVRWGGQINRFYSVAAHSIQVSYWVEIFGGSKQEQLIGLLHDVSESLGCGDLPTPIKKFIPAYVEMEDEMQKIIMAKYNLPYPYPDIVHKADHAALVHEAVNLKDEDPFWRSQFEKLGKINYIIEDAQSSPSHRWNPTDHIIIMNYEFTERFKYLYGK